jgi:myo-inositol-1(or 4)-monophosphatase
MSELTDLLEMSKAAAVRAAARLLESFDEVDRTYVHSAELPREVKAAADLILEHEVLQTLAAAGLPVLCEEAGYVAGSRDFGRWFIVDPLDGTFNFVKGLGPSAVSIALWEDQKPVFGVIYDLMQRQMAWGGAGMGACIDGRAISVSDTSQLARASICTGFPVRFDVEDDGALRGFRDQVSAYAKVRMIGSAAMSLLHVARGSADVYSEQSIMLWDVAAGLALVEGAGGAALFTRTGGDWCYDVIASNRILLPHVPGAERLSK